MILIWLSAQPFSSGISRYIIFTWGKVRSSIYKMDGLCVPATRRKPRVIKTSLEKTALHVEHFWAKARWLLCLQRASKDIQRGKACAEWWLRRVSGTSMLLSDGNPFSLSLFQMKSIQIEGGETNPDLTSSCFNWVWETGDWTWSWLRV